MRLKTVCAFSCINLSKKTENIRKTKTQSRYCQKTNSDRGGAVVILDVNDYIKESERQLNNATEN